MEQKLAESKLNKLNFKQKRHLDLLSAKFVKIKQERQCYCCKTIIRAGKIVVTASHFEVKNRNDKPVLVRHWVCNRCLDNKLTKKKLSLYERYYVNETPFIEQFYNLTAEESRELSFEQKMMLVNKALENGEIENAEYIDIKDDLIMEEAFREAEMNEF